MEPKLILPTLVVLGGAFFYLSDNQSFKMPDLGLGGMVTDLNGNVIGAVNGATPVMHSGSELLVIALGDLVEGIDTATISGAPAEIKLISMVADCAITKPMPGQRIADVIAEPGALPTQIYSYDDDEFARSAAYALQRLYGPGKADLAGLKQLHVGPMSDMSLTSVNVIVPPGPEPVYLVINDKSGGILWNILPMPGATVEHVTHLTTGNGGVVNLPEGATLQVPDIANGDCGAFARVVEDPSVTEARGFVPSDETRAQWAAYVAWYVETFGIAPGNGLTGRDEAYAVLAGAAPPEGAAKAVWAGVTGRIVHLMPAEVIYAAEEQRHEDWFTAKATAEITRAFGAPDGSDVLALIKPTTYQRNN